MKTLETLTKREEEIMITLLKGKLNKEISNDLYISLDTVKKHLKSIYKKLGARNRSEAIIRFYSLELNEANNQN